MNRDDHDQVDAVDLDALNDDQREGLTCINCGRSSGPMRPILTPNNPQSTMVFFHADTGVIVRLRGRLTMGKRRADGEGSITWDASVGRWVARLPVTSAAGEPRCPARPRRRWTSCARRCASATPGCRARRVRTTVKQFLEGWVRDSLPVMNLAESSKRKHESAVRPHLVPGLGRIQLLKLSPC